MTGLPCAVDSRVVEVDGIPMSALVCEARRPRAVVVALHGGAVTSRYFDYPDHPRLSLLRTGAALGFTVVAIDRPGYGSSAPYADGMSSPARRVELAYAAVDRLLASRPLCVVDDADVEEVVAGDHGVLAGLRQGGVIAVHSTVHP